MTYYVSNKTGKRYPAEDYLNHGWGGVKRGFKDLPHDEYPYSVVEEDENEAPEFMRPKGAPDSVDIVRCECGKFFFDRTFYYQMLPAGPAIKVPPLSDSELRQIEVGIKKMQDERDRRAS